MSPFFYSTLLALPKTCTVLCLYSSFNASLAGPKYLRGSNSAGLLAKTSRTAAVIAKRPSESMLILHTAEVAALRNCSSGIPTASFNAPPYLLIIATLSCGTEDDPWRTIGNPGIRLSISSRMSKRNGGGTRIPSALRVHCSGLNLFAPWEVPMEIANESTPVFFTKSSTKSGLV